MCWLKGIEGNGKDWKKKSFYKTGLGTGELITQDLLMEINGPDTMKFQDELTISMGHRQKKKKNPVYPESC